MARRTLLLALGIFFALMPLRAVVAQLPLRTVGAQDRMIVPGVRVGRWTLALTLDDLTRMHGYAVRLLVTAGIPPAADAVFDHTTYTWERVPFAAMAFQGRKRVEYLQIGFLMHSANGYRTTGGIGFMTRRSRVIAVYGRPTAEMAPHPLETRMIYDHLGIAFGLDMAGRVHTMYVFRPGEAGRFWHLL
jgi:hypothetical protein